MKAWTGILGKALAAGAFACLSAGTVTPAAAQSVRDMRIDLHPLGTQVGIVTAVHGETAWARLPHRALLNARIEFLTHSDGGDALAAGTVRWASPVPPFEVYVTNIQPVTTKHDINPNDDLSSTAALGKTKVELGTRPESDGYGVSLCIGFFARASAPNLPENTESVEPVRAHLRALRNRPNRAAAAISAAVERALTAPPFSLDGSGADDEPVDYTLLSDNLRRFRNLAIADPITKKIYERLVNLARENNTTGRSINPALLVPTPIPTQTGGAAAGARR